MKNIIYVTGNYGKYVSVKECFIEKNIEIDFYKYDFEEIFKVSHEVSLEECINTNPIVKVYRNVLKVFSPIM